MKKISIIALFLCISFVLNSCGVVDVKNLDYNEQSNIVAETDNISTLSFDETIITNTNIDVQNTKILNTQNINNTIVIITYLQKNSEIKFYKADNEQLNEYMMAINIPSELGIVTKASLDNNNDLWLSTVDVNNKAQIYQYKNNTFNLIYNAKENEVITEIIQDDKYVLFNTLIGEDLSLNVFSKTDNLLVTTIKTTNYPHATFLVNNIIYAVFSGNNILTYDTNGNILSENILPQEFSNLSTPSFINNDNTLFVINKNGISSVVNGGNITLKILSSNNHVYTNPNASLLSLTQDNSGVFYLSALVDGEFALVKYDANNDIVNEDITTLEIYSLYNNDLLQYAISTFTKENPNVNIEINFGKSRNDVNITNEDILRVFNTNLLAGEGPDVIILDGMPIDSMIESNLLLDISNIVDETLFYENMLLTYTKNDKTYAYPTMFRSNVIYRRESEFDKNLDIFNDDASLTDLLPILTDKSKIEFDGYETVFETLYYCASPSIFPSANSIEENALKEFLNVTNEIVKTQNLQGVAQTYALPGVATGYYSFEDENLYFYGESITNFSKKDSYGMTMFSTYSYAISMMNNESELGQKAQIIPSPNNTFMPIAIAGVSANTDKAQLAKDFVTHLLMVQKDENVPGLNYLNGFLMMKDVEKAKAIENYNSLTNAFGNIVLHPDDYNFESVFEKLTQPCNTNFVLKDKIFEHAVELYNNNLTLDETVNVIIDETSLYFMERS